MTAFLSVPILAVLSALFPYLSSGAAVEAPAESAVKLVVADKKGGAALQGVVVKLPDYGLWAVTDEKGCAVIRKVPPEK